MMGDEFPTIVIIKLSSHDYSKHSPNSPPFAVFQLGFIRYSAGKELRNMQMECASVRVRKMIYFLFTRGPLSSEWMPTLHRLKTLSSSAVS